MHHIYAVIPPQGDYKGSVVTIDPVIVATRGKPIFSSYYTIVGDNLTRLHYEVIEEMDRTVHRWTYSEPVYLGPTDKKEDCMIRRGTIHTEHVIITKEQDDEQTAVMAGGPATDGTGPGTGLHQEG